MMTHCILPRSGRVAILIGGMAALTACTLGPDYRPPQPTLPSAWTETAPVVATPGQQDLTHWWRGFQDAGLNRLIERALQDNLDLKAAKARIQAARAQISIDQAGLWPSINASSAYQRQRISPNALLGALGSIQNQGAPGSGLLSSLGPIGTPFNLFQAGFDASWELDLFGGIRRQQEAAEANADAIADSLRDIQVSLGAEVARLYLEWRALRCRLALADENLTTQREMSRLADARFREGLATSLQVEQANAALAGAESVIAPLHARIKNTRHALALLLGLPPAGLDKQLDGEPLTIPVPPTVQPGLPADLLRRRPDIRQAERSVAAASAAIGAAVAELFPKITLTGAAGFQSQDLSNFTQLSSGFYGFGPRLSLPIFQAGRLLANIDAQEARHQEMLASYDKTVLTALRDVEDGLASLHGAQGQRQTREAAERSAHKAVQAAQAYYHEGEIELQDVLDTRRAWTDSRDQLAQAQLAWAEAHVALFKALGGGW